MTERYQELLEELKYLRERLGETEEDREKILNALEGLTADEISSLCETYKEMKSNE